MFKQLTICAALMTFATGSANAQQRQAVMQKVEVSAATFDLIIAVPKAGGVIYDLAESPDALLVPLIGGELALGFDSEEKMLKAADMLQTPGCTFHVNGPGKAPLPVAAYVVPKIE